MDRIGAVQAAQQLFRCFPHQALSEADTFVAGVVMLFERYDAKVVSAACSPVSGLPSRCKFLPTIAEIKEALEAEARHADLVARHSTKRIASDSHAMPPIRNFATRSALCERFGLRAIPPGWDAIDVTRAAARYGAELPQIVEQMLADAPKGAPKSVYARVLDQAKAAMERRLGERPEAAE